MPTITRDALYELVWSKPLNVLATEYRISNVWLAKICDRLNIPRPRQGYWARSGARRLPRPPLPPTAPGKPDHAVLDEASVKADAASNVAPAPVPTIEVKEKLVGAHSVVAQLRELIKGPGHAADGMSVIPWRGQATFRVSNAQWDRALRILDALCRWISSQGHRIELRPLPNDRWRHALVVASGVDAFRISIMENLVQTPHVPKKSEFYARKFDQKPGGRLTLEFVDLEYNSSFVRCRDARVALETKLGEIAATIDAVFATIAAKRAQRDEELRQWQAAERARMAREEQKRFRDALAVDLKEMSDRWGQAKLIREFLDAAEAAMEAAGDARPAMATAWLAWARSHADAIDPILAPARIPKNLEPTSAASYDR